MKSHARPTVYLFDIDGTLLATGGAGRQAIDAAFRELWGRPDACAHFSFAGMTDRAIARLGLLAIGESVTDERIDQLIAAYLHNLEAAVAGSRDYRILPGVHQILAAVRERALGAVGLGTGNVQRGAAIKLARGALGAYFDFGGYGCDHEERAELLRIGAERGAGRLGQPRSACRVVVIGDTLRDVSAALAIGAECIGVGTGGTALEELSRAGAVAVFPDLTSAGALF